MLQIAVLDGFLLALQSATRGQRIGLTRWCVSLRLDLVKAFPATLNRRTLPRQVPSSLPEVHNLRINTAGKRKAKPMTPPIQLNRKVTYLFIALLLASFAFAQSGRAVTPEAVLNISEANAATGQQANEDEPNRRSFRFNFRDMRQCASGNVTMGGELVVTFQNVFRTPTNFRIKPKFIAVTAFSGTVQSGNRSLRVQSTEIKDVEAGTFLGRSFPLPHGTFKIEMIVTGPALPGGRPLRFKVLFSSNRYTFNNVQVTEFTPDRTPNVTCDL